MGHPRLRERLAAVIALMKASTAWDQFRRAIQRALSKYGTTLELPLNDEDILRRLRRPRPANATKLAVAHSLQQLLPAWQKRVGPVRSLDVEMVERAAEGPLRLLGCARTLVSFRHNRSAWKEPPLRQYHQL